MNSNAFQVLLVLAAVFAAPALSISCYQCDYGTGDYETRLLEGTRIGQRILERKSAAAGAGIASRFTGDEQGCTDNDEDIDSDLSEECLTGFDVCYTYYISEFPLKKKLKRSY